MYGRSEKLEGWMNRWKVKTNGWTDSKDGLMDRRTINMNRTTNGHTIKMDGPKVRQMEGRTYGRMVTERQME